MGARVTEQRVLPLKQNKPPETVKVMFHVSLLTLQKNNVVRVTAAHWRFDDASGSICFYNESATTCQTVFHKTGGYPTPCAMFKSRDVLSITRPESVINQLETHGWIEAVMLVEGRAEALVEPTEGKAK